MKSNSKTTYDSILRSYLAIIPKEQAITQNGLSLFVSELEKKNYSKSTVRLYYYAVLKTLKDLGVEIQDLNPPIIDEDEVNRHIYKEEEVNNLIDTAIRLGGIYAKSFVISTVYGLRRTEISKLDNSNINIADRILRVKSVKKGKTVNHLIPDNIVNFIDNSTKFLCDSGMSRIFNKVADMAGVNIEHSGWHSIRRALVSGLLLNGVPQEIVLGFMRWKTHTMLDIYHIRNPREDIVVFESHPFLKMWG
jgi:site-specific recombinase XerD